MTGWSGASNASTVVRREEMAPPAQRLFQPNRVATYADRERDMNEAIAEIRALIEAGMMTGAEGRSIIARLEDAR